MALIVEDGTMPANANSYNGLAAIRAYALNRGVDLTTNVTDAVLSAFAILATDWLETYSTQFVGKQSTITQSLSWPRTCVFNPDGSSFPTTGVGSIPLALQNACSQLCIEQNNGVILLPTTDHNTDGGFIINEKVDVISTTYSEKIGTTKSPLMPAVNRWLNLLLNPSPSGFNSIRV